MKKNRTTGHDIAPPVPKKHQAKPGELPEHRIPIFDYHGRRRGHVGYLASGATVARFTGQHGAKIGKKDGRTAWISPPPPPPPKPPKPPKPQLDPTAVAVAKTQANAKPQEHKLSIQLNQAKGSVTDKPSKPKASARPRKG
jgi:hypothetical protein